MKIKRTFAPTMREALNIVKLEQGDDAVILGNTKVPGGVEIISAIDYDQAKINAELAAQAAIQRKQQLSQNQAKSVTLKPQFSIAAKTPTAKTAKTVTPLFETVSLDRQEPVLGDIILGGQNEPQEKEEAPAQLKSISSHDVLSQLIAPTPKATFDWQSDSPQIKAAATQQEETMEFNGKAHAQNLLNSIKNLQAQTPQQKPKTPPNQTHVEQSTFQQAAGKKGFEADNIRRFQKNEGSAEKKPTGEQNEPQVMVEKRPIEETFAYQAAQEKPDIVQPALDEMKEEMRNLRQLMQCQLTTLDWAKYKKQNPVRSVLLNLLTEMGIGSDVCERILNQMDVKGDDPQLMWRYAMGLMSKLMPSSDDAILEDGGVVALVGATGVGKTTTIAKLAARFAHNHGKRSVALISSDNFRIGAQEQLQQYAKLLQIPLLTANSADELSDCLAMLTDKKLVLIDTAGVSQNDMRLSEQFHRLQKGLPQIKPLLVLSASTQLAVLNQTVNNFEKVRLAGVVMTKVDEAASLGAAITTSIRHQLPIKFCGLGQKVPEDLETAKSHRIISKAVALMQQYKETPNVETMAMRFNKIVSFGE